VTLDVTVTDLFCGAGGSSIGAEKAGARLVMAANHWRLAIETHNSNFPHADHDCADISQVNPRRYPRTNVLIASPECTTHSQARSHKTFDTLWDKADPGDERSRATMWDVPRFAEHHRYELVVVENVVEVLRWEPYGAWLQAMASLGYRFRQLFLNSMVAHPTPQSRDRLYVVFWRVGNPEPDLDIRPRAWCATCLVDVDAIQSWKRPDRRAGKYRAQYVYRCPSCAGIALPYAWPAAAAIDWTLPAPRIGDRAKPLAEATLRRITAGLERYGPAAVVQAAGNTYERPGYYRTWPLWQPLGTQAATAQHALVVDTAYAHGNDVTHVRRAADPLATQTSQQSQALVVPLRTHGSAEPAEVSPVPTIVAGNAGHALLIRNYTPRGDAGQMAHPVSAPAGTVTARGAIDALLVPFYRTGVAYRAAEPSHTVTALDRQALVQPAVDVDACGFRMLEPHEIGRAMAFPDAYVVHGTKRDRVRQYGNAVTPPVMDLILGRAIGSLAGGRAA
jgi:DNA (cytosine-5)-methyltransferase 1